MNRKMPFAVSGMLLGLWVYTGALKLNGGVLVFQLLGVSICVMSLFALLFLCDEKEEKYGVGK